MEAEMFNLTWDDFQQSTKETFRSLVNEEEFMDVTLACDDDKQLRAHKVILSACSPFFKNILVKNPHSSPLLFISGVNFTDLKAILNFMYLGETKVEQSHLETFMTACSILKVKGLSVESKVQDPQINTLQAEQTNIVLPETVTTPEKRTPALVKTEKVTSVDDGHGHSSALVNFEVQEDIPSFDNFLSFEGKFSCSKCEFLTSTKAHLKRHDEMKHQGIKYPCEGCDFKASTKDNLKRHSQSKHEGAIFYCNECEFKASVKANLRRHKLRMHIEQRSISESN